MKAATWESAAIAAPFYVLGVTQKNPTYFIIAALWFAAGAGMGMRARKGKKKKEEDKQ